MFLTPHELNFELLMKTQKKKENEKECVKAVLYIVILEYSLYSKLSCCIRFIHLVPRPGTRKPGFYRSEERLE